jgi:hypothetical protein
LVTTIIGKRHATRLNFPLLQFRVLRLGLLQDGDVGIGVLPEGEEVLIGSLGLRGISRIMGYNLLPKVRNMKTMAKRLLALSTILLAPFSLSAQSSSLDLTFGSHTLGEPVEVFFATAHVTGSSSQLATDYSKSLLADATVKEKTQQTQYEYRYFQVSGQQILEAAVKSCTL